MKKTNAIVKRLLSVLLALALVLGMVPAMNAEKAEAASAGEVLYLNTGGSSLWYQGGAWFTAYFFNASDNVMVAMEDADNDAIYEVTIPEGTWENVIFVRKNPANTGVDWDGVWNQTADLALPTDSKNCYTITGWGGSDGTWSEYVPVVYNWYAVGNGSGNWLNGVSWDPAAEANKMTEISSGVYEITFSNVAKGSDYQLKFARGAWDFNYGGSNGVLVNNGDNIAVTVPYCVADVTATMNLNDMTYSFNFVHTGEASYTNNGDGTHTYACDCLETNEIKAHTYVNGVCVCGAVEVEPIVITDNLRTLSLEDEVFINQYVAITGGNLTSEYIAANGGLLVWNGTVADEDAVYANAEVVKAGLNVSGEEYTQRTDGIVAKKYADVLTLRVYLKLEDGTYLYGDKVEYSVRDYCEAQIANASDAADVCAALLHYGAAAQVVFNYNTEDPANKNILESNPAAEWDASLLTAVVEPTTSIAATGDVKDRGKTLSLESAMAINYYFGVKNFEVGTDADSACLIVWDGVEGELTEANASAKIAMVVNPNMTDVVEYTAQVGDISAKEYGNTIYVCARFVDTEGNVHYSDVIAYSPEAYAAGRIENSQNANLIDVVKKMVVYGEEAAEYFANKQQ